MKVSLVPNTAKTTTDADTEYQTGSSDGKSTIHELNDKYFPDPNQADPVDPEVDPMDEHMNFFAADMKSKADEFAGVIVPEVAEVLADEKLNIEWTEKMEFYDILDSKYCNLTERIWNSINYLKTQIKEHPEMAHVFKDVIKKRKLALKKIEAERAKIDPLKASVKDTFEQEKALLTEYGKKYYQWSIKRQTGEIYENGEKALLTNKPDPSICDLNGDKIIGNPADSLIVIGEKPVEGDDGESATIYDIVNKKTKKPVIFNKAGELTGMDSTKDLEFHWTISNANLKFVEPAEDQKKNEIVLQATSDDTHNINNGLCNTAMAINIPEFVRMDKDGPVGIVNQGGKVIQDKAETEGDWILKRVVKVRVRTEKASNSKDGYDYVIELLGEEDIATPMMKIRIQGYGSTAAWERSLALIAASETDNPKYGRTSGINIEANTMKINADWKLKSGALEKIKAEYGITDIKKQSAFNSAMFHFTDSKEDVGLVVEGFNNVNMKGTQGNDIVLTEDAPEEYQYQHKTGMLGEEIIAPLYTNAIDGRGGFNAIFHKKGNIVADEIGFFWGGQEDDTIYINTPGKNYEVYYNCLNEFGHTSIGNIAFEDSKADSFGINDDYFGVASADYAFRNWWDPDVKKYLADSNLPEEPELDDDDPNPPAQEDYIPSDMLVQRDDITTRTKSQITAQAEELKKMAINTDDAHLLDYSGAELPGPATDMEHETDTFFAGWTDWTGGFTGQETYIPAFDDKKEGNGFGL